jgi:predicted ferric reductase
MPFDITLYTEHTIINFACIKMKILLTLTTLLWLPSVLFTWNNNVDIFYWRHHLTILSGAIALVFMTTSMLLAMRFKAVENIVHGLDKGYAIHKQMGMGALVALIVHWGLVQLPKWLISLGLMDGRQHRHGPNSDILTTINWTHLGKEVGNYTFYVFLIFAAISLIQAIRYHHFKWTHNIAGALFLAGVFHSLLMMDLKFTAISVDLFIVALCVVGAICAVMSLTGRIGQSRKHKGTVTEVQPIEYPSSNNRILNFTIQLEKPLEYEAGQFAYLNFHDGESPHPFSIAAYDQRNQRAEFAIKDLGDYTNKLFRSLTAGQAVTVEGGYGRFNIPKEQEQVWVGAGIGIVPFLAWLSTFPNTQIKASKIHLFYCRESEHEQYFASRVEAMAKSWPNLIVHIYTARQHQFLTADEIENLIDLATGSVSFCGPENFSLALKEQLGKKGLNSRRFYVEHFRMR